MKTPNYARESAIARLRKKGYTYKQIAEQVGCSIGTVCWTIAKLRKQQENPTRVLRVGKDYINLRLKR